MLALLCGTSSIAQTTAVLQGRVLDDLGAVLPGAVVTVRNDSLRVLPVRGPTRQRACYHSRRLRRSAATELCVENPVR